MAQQIPIREKMQQAKALIDAERYTEARKILHTIDHDKAYEWLDRLDEIAPEPVRTGRSRKIMKIVVGLVVLVLIAVAAVWGVVGYQMRQDILSHESTAKAAMVVFCEVNLGLPDYRCTQWYSERVAGDVGKIKEVLFCQDIYLGDGLYNPELFANCLSGRGIYLP